jgi:hypothetical protein
MTNSPDQPIRHDNENLQPKRVQCVITTFTCRRGVAYRLNCVR